MTDPQASILIIGAGQGGYQVAASLRQEGHTGPITLVGDEPGVPYQRPPLSKAYLLGKVAAPALRFRPPEWFDTQSIRRVQDRAVAIDRAQRQVRLAGGELLAYDHLVLATGARNRVPEVPGAELNGVIGIRTLADADLLAPHMGDVGQVVVIGAGFIGLEFAAVAAARGAQVQVLELGQRPMARALSEPSSELFRQGHESMGVNFHFNTGVARILGDKGQVSGVETSEGQVLPAQLVVYGIGVLPNGELAAQAGLAMDNGIAVDALLQTSDPAISALGDVASFPCAQLGGARLRLESVQAALDHARCIAARLMGKPAPYTALPWFWSDQGPLKLQIAGLSQACDETVSLGDAGAQQLSVLCFKAGKLVAVESTNRAADHMAARKLLVRENGLSPDLAREPGFDLKAYEAATRPAA